MLKIIIVLLIILLIVLLCYTCIGNDDDNILKDYEYLPIDNNPVYNNVRELLDKNENIKTDKNAVVYLLNWPHGFGSALSVFITNAVYLHDINPNIIVLPYWNENTTDFKYHEENYNNSFFLYFKYIGKNVDLKTSHVYFSKTDLIGGGLPVNQVIPYYSDTSNAKNIDYFTERFALSRHIEDLVSLDQISRHGMTNIGIHVRSLVKHRLENPGEYSQHELDDYLKLLKENIERKHNHNYNLFIATDIHEYIDKVREIFDNVKVYYIPFIDRGDDLDRDSMEQINENIGYKLGSDILCDCKMLSMCDKIFVRKSNVPWIVTLLNPRIEMEEY